MEVSIGGSKEIIEKVQANKYAMFGASSGFIAGMVLSSIYDKAGTKFLLYALGMTLIGTGLGIGLDKYSSINQK